MSIVSSILANHFQVYWNIYITYKYTYVYIFSKNSQRNVKIQIYSSKYFIYMKSENILLFAEENFRIQLHKRLNNFSLILLLIKINTDCKFLR